MTEPRSGVSFPVDLGVEIIDAHAHIGQYGQFYNGDGSADGEPAE